MTILHYARASSAYGTAQPDVSYPQLFELLSETDRGPRLQNALQVLQVLQESTDVEECPTFFRALHGGRRARRPARGAIAVVRGVALGFITSETLVFPCLLIDGVVATNDSNQLPTRVCDRCWRLFLWAMINESPSDMLSPANAAAVCVRRAEPAAVWRRDRHALRCPHEYASRELAPFHVGNTVCGRVSAPIARCCSLEPSPSRRHQRPRMLDFTSPVPYVSGLHQHHSTTASTPHSISAAASA